MKYFVEEIYFYKLDSIQHFFLNEGELVPLEVKEEDFFVEENIADIDGVLQKCIDFYEGNGDANGTSQWSKFFEFWYEFSGEKPWSDFFDFWHLIQEIKKFREMGEKVDDITYLYRKYKDIYPLSLQSSEELDFDYEEPTLVLLGKSEAQEIQVLQEEEGGEFIFFYKTETGEWTHFHPAHLYEVEEELQKRF